MSKERATAVRLVIRRSHSIQLSNDDWEVGHDIETLVLEDPRLVEALDFIRPKGQMNPGNVSLIGFEMIRPGEGNE